MFNVACELAQSMGRTKNFSTAKIELFLIGKKYSSFISDTCNIYIYTWTDLLTVHVMRRAWPSG